MYSNHRSPYVAIKGSNYINSIYNKDSIRAAILTLAKSPPAAPNDNTQNLVFGDGKASQKILCKLAVHAGIREEEFCPSTSSKLKHSPLVPSNSAFHYSQFQKGRCSESLKSCTSGPTINAVVTSKSLVECPSIVCSIIKNTGSSSISLDAITVVIQREDSSSPLHLNESFCDDYKCSPVHGNMHKLSCKAIDLLSGQPETTVFVRFSDSYSAVDHHLWSRELFISALTHESDYTLVIDEESATELEPDWIEKALVASDLYHAVVGTRGGLFGLQNIIRFEYPVGMNLEVWIMILSLLYYYIF